MVKEAFIVVGEPAPLQAEFSTTRRRGSAPRTVDFIDQSKGDIVSWHWDFGDDTTSDEQYPKHTYELAGTYPVSLTVTDGSLNTHTHTEADYVIVYVTSTVDNDDKYKSHARGRVIVDTSGPHKIPEEDLKYSRLFYLGCYTGDYFIGTLHRGKMFYTSGNWRDMHTGPGYLERYLSGASDEEILSWLNIPEEIYQFFDFTKRPPSLR